MKARFAPFSVTTESSRCLGAGLWCVALTSMSRRLLHRRYDMRGGEGNAALHRCEERRMLRLLKMMRRMLGRAGWIKCYYKWNSVGLILHRCFEGFAAWNMAYFLYFFLNKTVWISSLD